MSREGARSSEWPDKSTLVTSLRDGQKGGGVERGGGRVSGGGERKRERGRRGERGTAGWMEGDRQRHAGRQTNRHPQRTEERWKGESETHTK